MSQREYPEPRSYREAREQEVSLLNAIQDIQFQLKHKETAMFDSPAQEREWRKRTEFSLNKYMANLRQVQLYVEWHRNEQASALLEDMFDLLRLLVQQQPMLLDGALAQTVRKVARHLAQPETVD